MKKLLFVFNPHAGKGQIKDNLCDIVDIFTKGGYEVVTYPTQAKLDGYNQWFWTIYHFFIPPPFRLK